MSTVAIDGGLSRAPGLVTAFYESLVGKKAVMAVTGFILFGYVLVHMLANLQIFLPTPAGGTPALDRYALQLRVFPPVLWGARVVLLAAVVLHIIAAVQLSWLNKLESRTTRYVKYTPQASSYASRTMWWSGPIIFFYVIYHLLDLTFGRWNPNFEEGHVRHNVIASFQNPWVAGFYVVANVLLAIHLYHGVWSMCQTVGISHPRYTPILKTASAIFAVAIGVGFCAVPIAVLAGIVT